MLLLAGPDPASLADAGAFEAAAEKFGVEIVETRPFELTNDPRRRELSNLALLTGGVDYDVVYVADAVGEFARFVPYATYAPRPVVGSAGLRALAWHWSLERSGAPQLNQRFARRSDRRDVAAGLGRLGRRADGGRGDHQDRRHRHAASCAPSSNPTTSRSISTRACRAATGPGTASCASRSSLADSDATIAVAPLPQFLHETNVLDTLGTDRPQTACASR